MAFFRVSTHDGRAFPDGDSDSRCMAWPDFVRVEITDGEIQGDLDAVAVVVNLDSLPEDYVCTLAQFEAAIVPPVVSKHTTPGADGKPEEIIDRKSVIVACAREAAKAEARAKECAALREWQDVASLADVAARNVAYIEKALAGMGVVKEQFAPYVAAKAALDALIPAEAAAKVKLDAERAKPTEAVAGLGIAQAKQAAAAAKKAPTK